MRLNDLAFSVNGPDFFDNIVELLFTDKVSFVENDFVGKCNLLNTLILGPLGFLFLEMLKDMFGIDYSNDSVQSGIIGDILVNKEGLGNWSGVSHTCSLDDDGIKCSFLFDK